MRPRSVGLVAGREFRSFFLTPIGWVILFVFTALAGWWFFHQHRFFVQRQADLRALFDFFPWAFLLFAPAVTMRLWAEEKKQNTFETLLTTPLTPGELVCGKFLAALGVVAVWLLTLLPIVGVVAWFGEPDQGPVWGGFLAALLLGAAYVSIGVTVSACTENQIIALIGSFGASLGFFVVSQPLVAGLLPGLAGEVLRELSLGTHFVSIQRGVVELRDVLFYATFVGFFLTVNAWLVSRRRGSLFNLALAFGIAVALNSLVVRDSWRVDLTEDRRFTLHPVTQEVLDRLESPLRITGYFSSDFPEAYQDLRRDILDALEELRARRPGRIALEVRDPAKDDGARSDALALRLTEIPLRAGSATSMEVREVFSGIHLEYYDLETTLAQVLSPASLEHDLVEQIERITRPRPLRVGVHQNAKARARIEGGTPQRSVDDRHGIDSDLISLGRLVGRLFDVVSVDLRVPPPDEVATLIYPGNVRLDEEQKFHLDQFVMRGGSLIVLMEGNEPAGLGTQRAGTETVRGALKDVTMLDILSNWGISVEPDIVLDTRCARRAGQPYTPWVLLQGDSFAEHPITSGVPSMLLPYASSLTLRERPQTTVTELAHTSAQAASLTLGSTVVLEPERLPDPRRDRDQYRSKWLVAGLVEGIFHSSYTLNPKPETITADVVKTSPDGTRIVVVGSSDFATDAFVNHCSKTYRVTNLELVVNAVNWLTSDVDLSPLRARQLRVRPFDEPSEESQSVGLFVGVYLVPILLLLGGGGVYYWRRVVRPEAARRERSEAASEEATP